MPVMIVWLTTRLSKTKSEQRTQIIMAALERNPNLDVQDFLQKMAPPKKSFREKLVTLLFWGLALFGIGLGIALVPFMQKFVFDQSPAEHLSLIGGPIMLGGFGMIIAYFIGKKQLQDKTEQAKETEEMDKAEAPQE